eukprot:scaffold27803_cov81-Isochrysis_galbana.AAC.1
MRSSLVVRGGSRTMGSPAASVVSLVRLSMSGRRVCCSRAIRPGRAMACAQAAGDSAGPGSRRKWRSEKSSLTEFWMGVPVRSHRRSARRAKAAQAACEVCDLIAWASSSTTRRHTTPKRADPPRRRAPDVPPPVCAHSEARVP